MIAVGRQTFAKVKDQYTYNRTQAYKALSEAIASPPPEEEDLGGG